jgi:hypothetical protein
MIRKNQRILIVDDEQRAYSAKAPPGMIRSRDFFIQNHFQWFYDKYDWENFNYTDLMPKVSNLTKNNTLSLDMSRCFSTHNINRRPK